MTVEAQGYTVYRLYDAERSLLYVGCTINLEKRLAAHKYKREWWSEVASVETEVFEGRDEAATREAQLLKTLGPRHNGSHVYPAARTQRIDADKLREARISRHMTQRELSFGGGASWCKALRL